LFDEHMQWLAANTKIVRFSDVVAVRSQLGRARPTVAVTFDDGYDDNHRFALPVLVRHKIPATFFVTTGFADGDPEIVERFRNMLGVGPGETRGLGWTEIDELRAEGMDIGSHTITHPNLACLSDRDACNEIEGSKHRLEDHLASEIHSIAYPFGLPRRSFSRKTIEIAIRAGYKWGGAILFRDLRKQDGAWSIPRIAAANEPVESLKRKVVGGYDWLGFYQEHAPMWALTALSTNSVLASLADQM
jgi:peptidoglycan/xylan/chitin deacetylase (PgdA/CDA1 family)